MQASQKTTSILAKYAFALLALAKKTVRNGGKGKIYDKNIKCNNSGYRLRFSLYNAWTTFIKGEIMARIKSYKQAYMKEFNVTSEEYDKLYDVYALRARRYEKIHNIKLNKAKEFYWTAKLKKQGESISERRKEIASTKASSKPVTDNERDTKIKAYIDLHFSGLMKHNAQMRRIYNNPNFSWSEKLDKFEAIVANWTAEKKAAAESGDYEFSDGSVGYETDYAWLE